MKGRDAVFHWLSGLTGHSNTFKAYKNGILRYKTTLLGVRNENYIVIYLDNTQSLVEKNWTKVHELLQILLKFSFPFIILSKDFAESLDEETIKSLITFTRFQNVYFYIISSFKNKESRSVAKFREANIPLKLIAAALNSSTKESYVYVEPEHSPFAIGQLFGTFYTDSTKERETESFDIQFLTPFTNLYSFYKFIPLHACNIGTNLIPLNNDILIDIAKRLTCDHDCFLHNKFQQALKNLFFIYPDLQNKQK